MSDYSKYGPGNTGIERSHPEENQRNLSENYQKTPKNSLDRVEEKRELAIRRIKGIREILKEK